MSLVPTQPLPLPSLSGDPAPSFLTSVLSRPLYVGTAPSAAGQGFLQCPSPLPRWGQEAAVSSRLPFTPNLTSFLCYHKNPLGNGSRPQGPPTTANLHPPSIIRPWGGHAVQGHSPSSASPCGSRAGAVLAVAEGSSTEREVLGIRPYLVEGLMLGARSPTGKGLGLLGLLPS